MPRPPITSSISTGREPWRSAEPHGSQLWRAVKPHKLSSLRKGALHRMDGPAAILADFLDRGYSLHWFVASREIASVIDNPLFEKPIYSRKQVDHG